MAAPTLQNPIADVSQEVLKFPQPVILSDLAGNSYTLTPAGGIPVTQTSGISLLGAGNTGIPAAIPAIVQKANAKSTGSVASLAVAFTSGNTGGNSIVVVAGCGNGTAMTVADSAGNTYQSAIAAPNSTTFAAQIFYAVNVAGGANTVTVTNAGTAASMAAEVYEVSGLIQQVLGALGQTSSGTGTGTTATTSTIAGSGNCLAFMGVAIGTAVQNITVTTGTNWTADAGTNGLVPTTPSGLYQFQSLSQALSGLKPVLPTATLAGSEPWAAAAAVFKPVQLGIQGTVFIGGYNYTRVTSAATTQIKTGPGILHAIVVNKPTSTATIEADDALSNTTPVIAILGAFAASIAPFQLIYDVEFTTGLSVTVGTATVDATIVWR